MYIMKDGRLLVSLTDVSLFETVCINTCHTNASFFDVYWTGRQCGKGMRERFNNEQCVQPGNNCSRLIQKSIICSCMPVLQSVCLISRASNCGDLGSPTIAQRSLSSTTL